MHFSRTSHEHSISLAVALPLLRTVPTTHSAAFKRIDIANFAGVCKVKLDDIAAVVECYAQVWLQERILMEGSQRMKHRRGIDTRSGHGGEAGAGAGAAGAVPAHQAGRTQPQLVELTAQERWDYKGAGGIGSIFSDDVDAADAAELMLSSSVFTRLRSLFNRRFGLVGTVTVLCVNPRIGAASAPWCSSGRAADRVARRSCLG